jgi:hypothetical protein
MRNGCVALVPAAILRIPSPIQQTLHISEFLLSTFDENALAYTSQRLHSEFKNGGIPPKCRVPNKTESVVYFAKCLIDEKTA